MSINLIAAYPLSSKRRTHGVPLKFFQSAFSQFSISSVMLATAGKLFAALHIQCFRFVPHSLFRDCANNCLSINPILNCSLSLSLPFDKNVSKNLIMDNTRLNGIK